MANYRTAWTPTEHDWARVAFNTWRAAKEEAVMAVRKLYECQECGRTLPEDHDPALPCDRCVEFYEDGLDQNHGHEADADCDVDPATNECRVCGVDHGGPACSVCGGVAFHRDGCEIMLDERYLESRLPWYDRGNV